MAHRQLAEQYAKELNNANKQLGSTYQRVVELQITVADLEARLEQTKMPGSILSGPATTENATLQDQLITATRNMKDLEQTLSLNHLDLQRMKERADARDASAAATVKKLQNKLESTESLRRDDVGKLTAENLAAEKRIAQIEKENSELSNKMREQGDTAGRRDKKTADLEEEVKSMRQERGTMRMQITKLKENRHLNAQQHAFQSKSKQARGSAVREQEFTKLKRDFDLERKRR